jgi:YD repeat-containing protein
MTYSYDKLNRLETVTVPGMSPTTYSYDEVGNLAGYTYSNGVTTSYTYDNRKRQSKPMLVECGLPAY